MIQREVATVVVAGVALGAFLLARNINTEPPELPAEEAATRPEATPLPVAPPAVAQAAPTQNVAPSAPAPRAAEPAPAPAPKAAVRPAPAPTPARPAPVRKAPAPRPAEVRAAPTADSPLRRPSDKVKVSTDVALPPAIGPRDAKVHVIVFSDFQCPVCRRAVDASHQIAHEFPTEVRLEFWQHALKMHKNAEDAAVASLAAHRQGKFWEYHDLLFKNQRALGRDRLPAYAQQIGLDMARFNKDFADPALRKRVQTEGALAEKLGARGTPAFLINGRMSVGWGSWNGFRGMVERELTQARSALQSGTKPADLHRARAKANAKSDEAFEAYEAAVLAPRKSR